MKRTWTIIGAGDVPGSFKWYQALFGQPATLPAHDYFGQIIDRHLWAVVCRNLIRLRISLRNKYLVN